VQKYAANLEVLPPIEVNQHRELIDGWHRWTAHRKAGAETIRATVTETRSDVELLALACERNAAHGIQLAEDDKRRMAIRLFASGTGLGEADIERVLSVSRRSVSEYLRADKEQLRAERDAKIRALWLACHTLNEISEAVGVPLQTVHDLTATFPKTEALPKSEKLLAEFEDADWKPPLFDLWNQARNTNIPLALLGNICYALEQEGPPWRGNGVSGSYRRLGARHPRRCAINSGRWAPRRASSAASGWCPTPTGGGLSAGAVSMRGSNPA